MENSVDRESYSLAAGLALGLVTLKQGERTAGVPDLNVADMLHYYMVGGHRRPLTGAQRDKYKVASFQVRSCIFCFDLVQICRWLLIHVLDKRRLRCKLGRNSTRCNFSAWSDVPWHRKQGSGKLDGATRYAVLARFRPAGFLDAEDFGEGFDYVG